MKVFSPDPAFLHNVGFQFLSNKNEERSQNKGLEGRQVNDNRRQRKMLSWFTILWSLCPHPLLLSHKKWCTYPGQCSDSICWRPPWVTAKWFVFIRVRLFNWPPRASKPHRELSALISRGLLVCIYIYMIHCPSIAEFLPREKTSSIHKCGVCSLDSISPLNFTFFPY